MDREEFEKTTVAGQYSDLVSVVMPVYNAEAHLRETLDSLVSQSYENFEVIMVDDGSTDKSPIICQEYAASDTRFRYVRQKNSGAGPARNHGMDLACGEYIIFLDADDLFEPNLLGRMHEAIHSDGSDVCICRADQFVDDANGMTTSPFGESRRMPAGCYAPIAFAENFMQKVTKVTWDKMFRLEPIRRAGTRYQALRYSNDNYFILVSLMCARKISFIDDLLVHYRVGQGGSLRDTMYLDPLCDLECLDAVRGAFFSNRDETKMRMLASLNAYTLDALLDDYILLAAQSVAACGVYAEQMKLKYLPNWAAREGSEISASSMKYRFKQWVIENVGPEEMAWAVSPFDSGTLRSKPDRDTWRRLYVRIVLSKVTPVKKPAAMTAEKTRGGRI